MIEEHHDTEYYDGFVEFDKNSFDDENKEDFQEISFEDSKNNFIIEENFYKHDYSLTKCANDINWIKQLPIDEKIKLFEITQSTINYAREIINFHRIDGILILKDSKKLIILTEFFIIDFSFKNDKYELIRAIEIKNIDYITLARDGSLIILHLVPLIKNNENINKNFIIQSNGLENVVSCICSSHFYVKPMECTENRKICVITLNENFDCYDSIKNSNDFEEYR